MTETSFHNDSNVEFYLDEGYNDEGGQGNDPTNFREITEEENIVVANTSSADRILENSLKVITEITSEESNEKGKADSTGVKQSKSFKSGVSKDTVETGSTQEEELRNLSSTISISDEDFGRIVSPPDSTIFQTNHTLTSSKKPDFAYKGYKDEMMELEELKQTLRSENEHLKMLTAVLNASEEERNDLNAKLATLRVKLGVANANYNVSKTESDQLRKQNQEVQIQKARLEERISTCTADLEKLKDPGNPDSNVNLRKVAANDRKELKRLRNELEGIKSERSETQKQIEIKDERLRQLEMQISTVKEQLDTCQSDLDVALISAEAERKEREEIEVKLNDLIGEKMKFDDRMFKVQTKLNSTASGTTGIQKQVELFKEKEQKLLQSISTTEKKLRDAVTEIEQLKNRGMPSRIASSIKHHQYRMSRNSMVSDTTPRFKTSSIASTGSIGSKVSLASVGTAKSGCGQAGSGIKQSFQKGPSIQPTGTKLRPVNGKPK